MKRLFRNLVFFRVEVITLLPHYRSTEPESFFFDDNKVVFDLTLKSRREKNIRLGFTNEGICLQLNQQ